MKYVLLGRLNEGWATQHDERVKAARDKLAALGITLDSVHYTQGGYDFVDVIDAPDADAVLTFSAWYAQQGFGRIESLPAFDDTALRKAIYGA